MPYTILNETQEVYNYLKSTLMPKLQEEIDAYISRKGFYDSNSWDIITYNEIAILSLVKSAFIRGEEAKRVWALQEYEVFDKSNTPKGRADLFVMFRKPHFECDLLIEAKRDGKYNPNICYSQIEWDKSVKDATDQGLEYFKYEESYFSDTTYLLTMFFAYLDETDMEGYREWKIRYKPNNVDWLPYQFFITPYKTDKVLCVYGQIQKVNPKQ